MFWVLICTVHFNVCSCHVTYAFQSESTLYSCLDVKELLARSRCKIWTLSYCNTTWTWNHLVCKRTLNHLVKLVKWLSCMFWVLTCTVHLNLCSSHVTYVFQSDHESNSFKNFLFKITQLSPWKIYGYFFARSATFKGKHSFLWVPYFSISGEVSDMRYFCKGSLFTNGIKCCDFCWIYRMIVKLLQVL